MTDLPYYEIPEEPKDLNAPNVLARMIDALGFRYRWATEGFTESEITFRPVESSMNMMELNKHMQDLATWINNLFGGSYTRDKSEKSFEEMRKTALLALQEVSGLLKDMTPEKLENMEKIRKKEEKFTLWYSMNGPIADALTHVGQITSWRRISGNPQPSGVNVFYGTKK